jgi:hypothetical protein
MSAEDPNARYLRQASRRVIEPCEMSEDASAPSGWAQAAAAWIADMGKQGDYSRACVLAAQCWSASMAAGSRPR